MCAEKSPDKDPDLHSRRNTALIWLGGGDPHEPGDRHEHATDAVAGLIVLIGAVLAAVVATAAVAGATDWPLAAVLPVTVLCGVLAGAATRAISTGPTRGWLDLLGRAGFGLAVGVAAGELAACAVFAGPVDRQLEQSAESAPAVAVASAQLDRAAGARTALDEAVATARARRDDALVVARCEYHPTPTCPQTRITGVPGAGPETGTAKELLTEAQRDLDDAVAVRERRTPELDGDVAAAEQALTLAHQDAVSAADRGIGTRWIAMNDYTRSNPGALLLRLALTVAFALLTLLPLIIKRWRGETTRDRRAVARAEVDRAERQADVAIAVKRAEIRAAAESLWAEQQLTQTRLAVQAQTEIDAARQHRRITEALGGPVAVASQRSTEPEAQEAHVEIPDLPAVAELPAAPDRLPARVETAPAAVPGSSLIPGIPDIARTAARWLRPLVPPVVARAIDTTTHPVRSVRRAFDEIFEEVEEITFTLKRTRRVNVHSATADDRPALAAGRPQAEPHRAQVHPVTADDPRLPLSTGRHAALSEPGLAELTERDGHLTLSAGNPPALPPG